MRDNPFQFLVGDKIGRYEVIQPPGMDARSGDIASPLSDKGATSIVYLVNQSLGDSASIPRVMKLFAPTEELRKKNVEAGETYGKSNFLAEMKLIASLTHQNLVKIIDAGEVQQGVQYYVMEFIDGSTLEDLLDPNAGSFAPMRERAHEDPTIVIQLARQLVLALMYMHSNRYFHFDVAPKNIFVRGATTRPHVVLGDLGVARKIRVAGEAEDTTLIFVAGTEKYTPPDLQSLRSTHVSETLLSTVANRWDNYSVCGVILDMINNWGLGARPELKALQILIDRISKSHLYESSKLFKELGRLLPADVLTAGIEELSSDAAGRRRYVNIPLYRVPITSRLEKLINHPQFTRLQLVPQMFLVRSSFPGGVHSMYEHALGSFALSQRILQKQLSFPNFRAAFSDKELHEALITSLCVRLSSFTLDRVVLETTNLSRSELLKERFEDVSEKGGVSFSGLAVRLFPDIDLKSIWSILTNQVDTLESYQKFILGMIKSSIDIRVLDYLARDSYHTGIPVGGGVDVSNIINNMVWISDNHSLGIRRNGVFDLENLFCARYWMFSRVYWSSGIRAISAMLRHVVYTLTRPGRMDPMNLAHKLGDVDEAGALNVLNDEWNTAVRGPKPRILKLLGQGRPRTYATIVQLFDRNWDYMQAARDRLNSAEALEQLSIDFHLASATRGTWDSSDVLFDLPLERAEKLGEDIVVEIESGHNTSAAQASDIIKILPQTFERSALRLRVFCNPRIDKTLQDKLAQEAKEFLTKRFSNA
jgi:serine/threonine protein kinase